MKVLHLFQWKLGDITAGIPKVKEQGFDAIQISPLSFVPWIGDICIASNPRNKG